MVEGQTLVLTPAELFSEGLVEDPYPTYRRFLDAGPAHYVNYKQGVGAWAIFSHAGCSTAIRDVRLTAKRMDTLLLTIAPEHRTEFGELTRTTSVLLLFD